jgi:AraC-like DNA-binding protein
MKNIAKLGHIPVINFDLKSIENGGFELIEIKEGWLNGRNILNAPHRHIFHELIWIKKGPDYHTVDYENYEIDDNQILFIPKDSLHNYKPNPNAKGWKLIFAENFFTSNQFKIIKDFMIFIPCRGKMVVKLKDDQSETINSFFTMLQSMTSVRQKQTLIISLLTFIEDYILTEIRTPNSIFIKFIKLLNQNMPEHKSVSFYALRLNITTKTLNEIIRQSTGKTTIDYIHSRLLLEAKRKLRNSDLHIKEIAHSLGFSDPLYFSRFFKKNCGLGPEKFRKQNS